MNEVLSLSYLSGGSHGLRQQFYLRPFATQHNNQFIVVFRYPLYPVCCFWILAKSPAMPEFAKKAAPMTHHRETIVNTPSGRIEGVYQGKQYLFKGIPFAVPPVGELRWLPPQPVKPWKGILPAKEFGPISPQNQLPGADMMASLMIDEPQDENCLFLNIWTQGIDKARRPVMVWIHGGAFIIGAGSQTMYRRNTLVSRGDIVLVSINYRLGALGFMNLSEVTGGKIPATGSEGLLDQVAALEWVHDNIESFGGDPDNITIFGESAGAMSIGCLMGMPSAKGKFQKSILESGAANTVCSLEEGAAASAQFLDVLGLGGNDMRALRSLSVEQLLSAQQKLGDIMRARDNRITPFQPVVDGIALPEMPIHAIRSGSASDIKTLAGTNLDEFKLFSIMDPSLRKLDETGIVGRLEGLIPPQHVHLVIDAYRAGRKKRGESTTPEDLLSAIQTDLMFRIPALRLVEAQCSNNQSAYNYLFTWKSPVMGGVLGSCHALEIGFVFGNHDDSFCGSGTEADALSRQIQDAWIAFARTGNPSCESIGRWEPYGDSRTTMMLDKACRLENAPYEVERRIWDTFEMLFTKPI
jgi:para-nitrobenzyl esterase